MRRFAWMMLACACAFAQAPDPYGPLRAKQYDIAIANFEKTIAAEPNRADLHTDLAYSLLKVGETAAARDQFAEALKLDPSNDHVALEYAFLCYETKEQVQARRTFDQLRQKGNATAAEAFENIDKPLREGIARWQAAVDQSPNNFSSHEELAHLAEQRDELELASEHYERAWKLRTDRRDLLLDLGRVWKEQGNAEGAMVALLAASRGAEPRIAETAKALLPDRYPYVYEFEGALALDPTNEELRRELAYLHQAMGNDGAAKREFDKLPERPAPLEAAAFIDMGADTSGAKVMAERSFEKGYFKDAARYFRSAYESDPADFGVILKLGQTYNIMKDDREAVRWFGLARSSPDDAIAREAKRAYSNLSAGLRKWRTSMWMFPMVSTRWQDTFIYAQGKAEYKLTNLPFHPYASVRFVGDIRGRVFIPSVGPQFLSEQSVIPGVGVSTNPWHRATGWFEVGSALKYSQGGAELDVRGGVSYANRRNKGKWFAETNDDAVYVRRFNRDTLFYSQNRGGYTISDAVQVFWNANATQDVKREYWANTVETGPGVRWRVSGVELSVNFLRGAYTVNDSNPHRPNYNDVRIGVWYAFSH
jgi:Tfp pilus assembly protein PilF